MSKLLNFPVDVLMLSASFLDINDILRLHCVHHDLNAYIHQYGLWCDFFRSRYNHLNWALPPEVPIQIEDDIPSLYHSRSHCYRRLTHAIKKLPCQMDIGRSNYFLSSPDEGFVVNDLPTEEKKGYTSFAFTGQQLGNDRAVRANVPYSATRPHLIVYATLKENLRQFVGAVITGGYFELTISQAKVKARRRSSFYHFRDCVAIGLATDEFKLKGKQPGWDRFSFGYHGDDGHFFHNCSRGEDYGPEFGPGDTVGCGVYRNEQSKASTIFFTLNGAHLGNACDTRLQHLYPVVGLDSNNIINMNFGNQPFRYDGYGYIRSVEKSLRSFMSVFQLPYTLISSSEEEEQMGVFRVTRDIQNEMYDVEYSSENSMSDSDYFMSAEELDEEESEEENL